MTRSLDPHAEAWMTAPATRAVMEALLAGGGEARFVGGAVRNALLREPVGDVDIATQLLPDEVIARLKAAGLGAVPTGIAHGTITAIADGTPFEITTLRRDVSTDGRRATIAFTDKWEEDAARRDFTMNAIYAKPDGSLFDPTGGIEDIAARRVRFVGEARARIREDYLRALRLFRFHAWYGAGAIDDEALDAAIAEKAGLKTLSGERVQKEIFRTLEAPDPIPVLEIMQSAGILAEILPPGLEIARTKTVFAILKTRGRKARASVALMLMMPGEEAARKVAADLRLSNADRERLSHIAYASGIDGPRSRDETRRLIYRIGRERLEDEVLLSAAKAPNDAGWGATLDEIETWIEPQFPLDGKDAKEAGIKEGPAIGRTLAALEEWWVEENFLPDRKALLVKLQERAAR